MLLNYSRGSAPPQAHTADPVLAWVEIFPCSSRRHVPPGTHVRYATDPPVCGPHYATVVKPGLYTEEQVPEELVHALEYGNVVIYYDRPGEAALEALQAPARQYTGAWDDVIVTPSRAWARPSCSPRGVNA